MQRDAKFLVIDWLKWDDMWVTSTPRVKTACWFLAYRPFAHLYMHIKASYQKFPKN